MKTANSAIAARRLPGSKPRNPFVAAAHRRLAGRHAGAEKTTRSDTRRLLHIDLATLNSRDP